MGKGTIISHIADGEYNVTLNYDSTGIDAQIAVLEARETMLIAAISAETDAIKIKLLRLQLLSVQKRIDYLSSTNHVPVDDNITAWCADLTTDLTGEVGLIEIGREKINGVNIQPGYDSNAVYDGDRDGQLVPLMAQTSPATFYNLAMLPGTQKWKPTYLYGTITAINEPANTCTVMLDSITSSQQALNIVSTAYSITDVPISYMDCDVDAFAVDDEVIVKYEGYAPAVPKVVGFKDHPMPCECLWTEEWDGPLVTTKWAWAEDSGASAFYYLPSPPTGPVQFDYTLPAGAVAEVITACTGDPPQAQDCSFLTVSCAGIVLDVEAGYEAWAKSSSMYYNLTYSNNWINENPISFIVNADLKNALKYPTEFAIAFAGYLDGQWYYFYVWLKNVSTSLFMQAVSPVGSYSEPFRWNGTGFNSVQKVYQRTGPLYDEFELVEQAGWIQPYGYTRTYMTTAALNDSGRISFPGGLDGIKIYYARAAVRKTSTSLTLAEWEAIINHIGVC